MDAIDITGLEGNFERPQRVKQAYDPDNLFRVNRNVAIGS